MTLTTDRLIQGDRLIRCRIIQVWLYLIIEFSSIFSSCLWKHNRQILSCSVFKQVLESGQWLHANQWNHKVSVLNISWKVCEFKHVVTISRQSYRMEQFRLSVQRNLGLLCLCFTLLYDWSRKLASLSQPIRCRTITNNCLVVRVFPRFRQFGYFYCAFSLALWVFSFILIGRCDYFSFAFMSINQEARNTVLSKLRVVLQLLYKWQIWEYFVNFTT